MKLCTSHSHDLRAVLMRKGLWHLVKPERAAEAAKEWLDGNTTDATFDPYVGCVVEINGKAQDMGIVHRLQPEDTCPLCETNRHLQRTDAAMMWIDNVTDAVLLVAKVNHLVPMGHSN